MSEDRIFSISSTNRMSGDEVARHTFATTRRGFEPSEVRKFLEDVGRELRHTAEREQDLRQRLADAEHRAANPVLDEATLTTALGTETARVLRSAHDAAAELLQRAEAESAALLEQARQVEEQAREEAEQARAEHDARIEAGVADLRRQLEAEAVTTTEAARRDAQALIERTRTECRNAVQQAQELRTRVLTDLTQRRKVLVVQIEQLRVGRERLAEAILQARQTVDQISEDLFTAEDEARRAAEEAGRHAADNEPLDVDDVGAAALADVAGAIDAPMAPADAEHGAGGPAEMGEADTGAAGHSGDGGSEVAVDDIFAKLRAAQHEQVDPTPPEAGTTEPATTEPATTEPATNESGTNQLATTEPATDDAEAATKLETPAVATAPAPEATAEGTEPSNRSSNGSAPAAEEASEAVAARDPRLERRDEMVRSIVAGLARRLKRALQDDQNDMLDRIRGKRRQDRPALLDQRDHERRFAQASAGFLDEAARAGAVFAGGDAGKAPATGDLGSQLAALIVAPLRRRIEEEGPALAGDDAAMVDLIGAAFREWKGGRVERLAGDHVVAAFSMAVVQATPPGRELRWVVDDDGGECADCDDNALAEPSAPGEAFPTGHVHPPAHAGCRCLLVTASA